MDSSMENAIKYIGQELKANPDADKNKLIEVASQKFNLTPIQTEFLVTKYLLGG